ncbi:RimK family alpha-L-glutamate ligase [Pontibacillus sp. HMF3514]|uniref:ATP-grasp domain-containing protein n=1 Tax=Pontibacillus sp. HMF3514 TaxID=2692425 RepID=UPI0013201156|nr:ATP-grasp domain-containing protein [Pontibacillus sp. HMF3514]QHE53155.1 ATP-grasp domain-containing protein [Pontibacillus sp. HMF3514]
MSKTGWLIYIKEEAERNRSFIDMFIEEARKQGIILQLKLREAFHIGVQEHQLVCWIEGQRTELPDFAVVRTIDPLFTEQLECLGVPCFNSSDVARICNDKAKTHQFLAQQGVPMVDTLFLKGEALSSIPFSFPLIAKEVHGRGGKNVYWVNDEDEVQELSFEPQQDLVIQKPASKLGKDLRVFVVGNKIVGAILRQNKNEFKANYTLGGSASLYELSEQERELAHKVIEPFEFGMVGIDFLFDEENHLLLNEIEDVVGSRTLYQESSINILELYVSYISSKIKTV